MAACQAFSLPMQEGKRALAAAEVQAFIARLDRTVQMPSHLGGCLADPFWIGTLSSLSSLRNAIAINWPARSSEADLDNLDRDFKDWMECLQSNLKHRATPWWGIPRYIWAALAQRSDKLYQALYCFLYMVLSAGRLPAQMITTQMVPADKKNNKPGTRAFRLIQLCDDLAKSLLGSIWSKRQNYYAYNTFGFVPIRSRQDAVILIALSRWWLKHQHKSSISLFYDLANAFGSSKHVNLNRAIGDCAAGKHHDVLCSTHLCAVWLIDIDGPNVIAVAPQAGDAQGSVVAPQKFVSGVAPVFEHIFKSVRTMLADICIKCFCPFTHRTVYIGDVTFCDDVAQVLPLASYKSLNNFLMNRFSVFDDELFHAGFAQNHDKLQTLATFVGEDSQVARTWLSKNTDLRRKYGVQLDGAKHLGSYHALDGCCGFDVDKHIASAGRALLKIKKILTMTSIRLAFRANIYRTLIRSVLVSGLEVVIFNNTVSLKLGRFQTNTLRLLGCGILRRINNDVVRQLTRCPTIQSCVLVQRLRC